MQNPKLTTECVLLSVPVDILEEAGICEGDLIQITAERGRIVITNNTDTDDYICDGICEDCPISENCNESEVF